MFVKEGVFNAKCYFSLLNILVCLIYLNEGKTLGRVVPDRVMVELVAAWANIPEGGAEHSLLSDLVYSFGLDDQLKTKIKLGGQFAKMKRAGR